MTATSHCNFFAKLTVPASAGSRGAGFRLRDAPGSGGLAQHCADALDSLDFDVLAMDRNHAFVLEVRERAADRFELESKVAADFLARHAQDELGRRVAARDEALRQIQQEGCQALFRAHAAEQQHYAVVARDFAAHDAMKMLLQRRDVAAEALELRKGDFADFAVLERDRI